jgi:hypothetical protein
MVNKVMLIDIKNLYTVKLLSIPDISRLINIPRSTVRNRLLKNGVILRKRTEAMKMAKLNPNKRGIGIKHKGFSEETKRRMSISRIKYCSNNSIGVSLKPSGYYEITKGINKGRCLHDIVVERHLKRKLLKNEVVHHKNGIKTDNNFNNLEVMTRSEHSKIHSIERVKNGNGISSYRKEMRGEEHPSAKLTEKDVLEIINNKNSSAVLAANYGVQRSCIKKIRTGRTWSYLTNIKYKQL